MKKYLVADKIQIDNAVLIKLLKCIRLLLGITNSICIMDQGCRQTIYVHPCGNF